MEWPTTDHLYFFILCFFYRKEEPLTSKYKKKLYMQLEIFFFCMGL